MILQCDVDGQVIARVLKRPGEGRLCLDRLPRSAGGGSCGDTALQHFLYRATARTQYVMPAFSPPLNLPELRQVGSLPAASNMPCPKHSLDARQRVQGVTEDHIRLRKCELTLQMSNLQADMSSAGQVLHVSQYQASCEIHLLG